MRRRGRYGKTMTPPGFIPFQHPKLVSVPPSGSEWVHEAKLDGYRMELQTFRRRRTWFTRSGLDWSSRLVDLDEATAGLSDCVLDGELCARDAEGRVSFSRLRASMGRRQAGRLEGDLTYFVFDLLWLRGRDLREEPYRDRRARLERLLMTASDPRLFLVQHLPPAPPVRGAGARRSPLPCPWPSACRPAWWRHRRALSWRMADPSARQPPPAPHLLLRARSARCSRDRCPAAADCCRRGPASPWPAWRPRPEPWSWSRWGDCGCLQPVQPAVRKPHSGGSAGATS
jgi:hypothetical protein